MPNPLATLNDASPAPTAAASPRVPSGIHKGPPAMRFTYPSGSQPLDGFTIKRGIGIGGFGEVYFAISDAGKEVAIKRIQRNLDVELRGVKQCLNLKHVNLIGLWDIRSNDLGESWVVMEYVPGYSLREKLEHHPTGMPEAELKHWFLSIASGVSYLHKHGIVHRDLKPGNIFYDTDQQMVKIGDYGLSKFISCSKRSGQTESVGTFHYMAPEIGKGVYGKEIDIYALGIIFFEMLTGDLPFNGESAQEIIMKHLTADPDLRSIPDPYQPLIARCLEKDPAHRYHHVAQMLADLPWPEVAAGTVTAEAVWTPPPRVLTTAAAAPPHGEIAFTRDVSAVPRGELSTQPGGGSREPFSRQSPVSEEREVLYIGDHGVEVLRTGRTSVQSATAAMANRFSGLGKGTAGGVARQRPPEPIAQAMRSGMQGAWSWWNGSDVSVPLKVTLAVVASIVLIMNSAWLLVVALCLGFVYLGYAAIRNWLLPAEHEVNAGEPQLTSQQQRERSLRDWLSQRGWEERLMDLTGSLLISAVSCSVLSFLGLAVHGTIWDPTWEAWAIYVWMALTSTAACWLLLIANKSWEHRAGDPWLRRLTLTTGGFLLGIGSLLLGRWFFIDSFAEALSSAGVPQIPSLSEVTQFLIFFALWLGLTHSWSLLDPARATRLRLWRVGVGLAGGVLLSQAVGLNAVLFGMLAVVTSIAVQLASPLLTWEQLRNQPTTVKEPSGAPRVKELWG